MSEREYVVGEADGDVVYGPEVVPGVVPYIKRMTVDEAEALMKMHLGSGSAPTVYRLVPIPLDDGRKAATA